MHNLIKIFSLATLIAFSTMVKADYYLITNNNVNIKTISHSAIKSIFLGRKKLWDNGTNVMPCYMSPIKSPTEKFFKTVLKKDSSSFIRHWNKMLFSGSGNPPYSTDSLDELLEYAGKNKGSICVIDHDLKKSPDNIGFINIE